MEGIGVILLIFFAIASSINKKAMKRMKDAKGGQVKTDKPAPESPFRKAIRQLQEAADLAMGQEPAKQPMPPSRPNAARERIAEEERKMEPAFRGSVADRSEPAPLPLFAEEEKPSPRMAAPQQPSAPAQRLPLMGASGLVQAVIAQEILNRPRSARWPYNSGKRSGA